MIKQCECIQCHNLIPEYRIFVDTNKAKTSRSTFVSCGTCASVFEKRESLNSEGAWETDAVARVTDLKKITGILERVRIAEGTLQAQGA